MPDECTGLLPAADLGRSQALVGADSILELSILYSHILYCAHVGVYALDPAT
jgi:hypothetical protein